MFFGWLAFVWVTIFTNAPLFLSSFKSLFYSQNFIQSQNIKENLEQDASIYSIIDQQFQKESEIEKLIAKYKNQNWNIALPISKDMDEFLLENMKWYEFSFNTLPPTNRLIVPRFNVDDPIVISKYTNMNEFIYKNYNEELKEWVVKYPTTPEPWQAGNTLIFGHTSQERWKYNPYGMAFAHIAKMEIWDTIQIVRNWQLYEYRVVDIQIKYPQHVNDTYMQYANASKNYLTLMWCYPIWTAKQRILIIAEELSVE